MVQCIGLQNRFKIYLSDYSSAIYNSNIANSFKSNPTFSGNCDQIMDNNFNQISANNPNRNFCKTPEFHIRHQTQDNPELFLYKNQNRLVESMIRHNKSQFPRRCSFNEANSQPISDFSVFFKISKLDHKLSCIYPTKNKTNFSGLFTPDASLNGKNQRKCNNNSFDSRNIKGSKNHSSNCLKRINRNLHSGIFITGMPCGRKQYLSKLEIFAAKIQKKLKESLVKINNHNGVKNNYVPYKELIQFKEKTKRKIDINKMLICKNAIFNYRGDRKCSKEGKSNKPKSRKSNDPSINFKNKTLNIIHCLIPSAIMDHQD